MENPEPQPRLRWALVATALLVAWSVAAPVAVADAAEPRPDPAGREGAPMATDQCSGLLNGLLCGIGDICFFCI